MANEHAPTTNVNICSIHLKANARRSRHLSRSIQKFSITSGWLRSSREVFWKTRWIEFIPFLWENPIKTWTKTLPWIPLIKIVRTMAYEPGFAEKISLDIESGPVNDKLLISSWFKGVFPLRVAPADSRSWSFLHYHALRHFDEPLNLFADLEGVKIPPLSPRTSIPHFFRQPWHTSLNRNDLWSWNERKINKFNGRNVFSTLLTVLLLLPLHPSKNSVKKFMKLIFLHTHDMPKRIFNHLHERKRTLNGAHKNLFITFSAVFGITR